MKKLVSLFIVAVVLCVIVGVCEVFLSDIGRVKERRELVRIVESELKLIYDSFNTELVASSGDVDVAISRVKNRMSDLQLQNQDYRFMPNAEAFDPLVIYIGELKDVNGYYVSKNGFIASRYVKIEKSEKTVKMNEDIASD